MTNNTITAAKDFMAAGISCGIKESGKKDLGLIVCLKGATAAALFTTNKIVSAAVTVSREHIKSARVYGMVVNSGNANACTGRVGINNAVKMCAETARLLRGARNDIKSKMQYSPRGILIASTGIIGHRLPIGKIKSGIAKAIKKLSDSQQAGLDFAQAIMTTDTKIKQVVRRFKIEGKVVTIAGVTKGAGMIGPNMATTLCFITTDAAIAKSLLARALKGAIDNSLNKLTVDGHQSTNDTVVLIASGAAGNRVIVNEGRQYKKFLGELMLLCDDLARQMALDAEGATKCFKVVVNGAANKQDASKAARAVANYDLVKCAIHGNDPNWGRIICAVGSCGVKLNEQKLSCKIGDITVFKNGRPAKFDAAKASRIIARKEHTITVDLGVGRESDFCYGCDLSKDYITINADYHT